MELNDLLTELGIEPKPAAPPAPAEPAATPPATPAEPAPATEPTSVTEPTPGEPTPPTEPAEPTQNTQQQRQNKAFAEMRAQNQQYQKLMKSLGTLLNANETDPTALINLVQDKIVQAQAKQQGIPEEFLKRFNMLESEFNRNQQLNLQQQALLGFQQVKTKYGLDDAGLSAFSDKLVEMGINPFEQTNVDLTKVYKDIYFDDLMQKAVEKALQTERERVAKAATSSTNPGTTTGTNPAEPSAIKNVNDLDKWFNSQKK